MVLVNLHTVHHFSMKSTVVLVSVLVSTLTTNLNYKILSLIALLSMVLGHLDFLDIPTKQLVLLHLKILKLDLHTVLDLEQAYR